MELAKRIRRFSVTATLVAGAVVGSASAALAEEAAVAPAVSVVAAPEAAAPVSAAAKPGECLFLVFSNPVKGREEEFERWYTGQHVADVVNAAGFDTGRRFRLSGDGPHRYLALYQVSCDNPAANAEALHKAMESGNLKMSDSFDYETAKAMIYVVHSPLVTR